MGGKTWKLGKFSALIDERLIRLAEDFALHLSIQERPSIRFNGTACEG